MRWITWKQQTKLAQLVRYYVDTGSGTNILVQRLVEEHPEYTVEAVHKEIEWLKTLWLLVYDPEQDWLQVTEFARNGLYRAVTRELHVDLDDCDAATCLKWLKERGVFHRDMVQYGIVAKQNVPE